MSDLVRNDFEQWFARISLQAGIHLNLDDVKALRGPKGDYSTRPYMHGCYVGWLGGIQHKSVSPPGAAQ